MGKAKGWDLLSSLQMEYDRWSEVYQYGVSGHCYSDGSALNQIRNHILYLKRVIEEERSLFQFTEEYQRELPPVVDEDYMAQPEYIRGMAQFSLREIENDPHYVFLAARQEAVSENEQMRQLTAEVIGYAETLRRAVEEDDLVTMRRYENPKRYLLAFENCSKSVKEYLLSQEEEAPMGFTHQM